MEGKCRPHTVQRRLQSEVEGCDWWKEKHLFISFINLNSCESHERQRSHWRLQQGNRAGSRRLGFQSRERFKEWDERDEMVDGCDLMFEMKGKCSSYQLHRVRGEVKAAAVFS